MQPRMEAAAVQQSERWTFAQKAIAAASGALLCLVAAIQLALDRR